MRLSHRIYGDHPSIVLLHGLLGSRDNWHTFASALDRIGAVAADLRNHGDSPHAPDMDYAAMAADVIELCDSIGVKDAVFIGHSMGGKAAMEIALSEPDRVRALVIEDMVPNETSPVNSIYVEALRRIDLSTVSSRRDAERLLERDVSDRTVRLFLLKNLERIDDGSYRWRANLDAIHRSYDDIWASLQPGRTFAGPALFVRGGRSETVTGSRAESIPEFFPHAELKTIDDVGHWVHAMAPDEFSDLVMPFLTEHTIR